MALHTMELNPASDRPVVLVVDDAPSSLGVLCDTLESAGYTVLVAGDGETALQRLELVTPDAILLDGLMPGLSGFDTCRRIKETPAWAHVPVIFMTGLSETSNVVEGFACGGVDYVVKPLRAALDVALEADSTQVVHTRTDPPLSVRNMGTATLGETMLLLELQREGTLASSRLAHAALTPRETEVLSWLAKGKTNRDIADILGMSPRTVNKHLEHVFEKLGVETRAAAAALASGCLP